MDDLRIEDARHENGIDKEPPFSEEEKEVLDLYDQVQKLEVEVALTKARVRLAGESAKDARKGDGAESEADDDDAADSKEIVAARDQLRGAMALYNLRNTVVTNVLIANPILKGIHNSTFSSPIEQDLLPWVQARDATSYTVAAQSATFRHVLDQLTEVESETLRVCRKNRDVAAEVLRLANEADRDKDDAIADDPAAKEQIEKLEQRLATSRQKWRVMKGTASGIVAGSGVDWASDPGLRDVVLDPE